MPDRSYLHLHDSHAPLIVDAAASCDKSGSGSRRPENIPGKDQQSQRHSKRGVPHRAPKNGSSQCQKSSTPQANDKHVGEPSFELHIVRQPAKAVSFGMPVEISVVVSVLFAGSDNTTSLNSVDTSSLFAATSLVEDCRNTGDRVPLEAGILTGQKMFDSIHSIPTEDAERLASRQPRRLALGYFTFPGLLIRQPGAYRIRTTLLKMNSSGGAGVTGVKAVDSEPIRIERRNTLTPR